MLKRVFFPLSLCTIIAVMIVVIPTSTKELPAAVEMPALDQAVLEWEGPKAILTSTKELPAAELSPDKNAALALCCPFPNCGGGCGTANGCGQANFASCWWTSPPELQCATNGCLLICDLTCYGCIDYRGQEWYDQCRLGCFAGWVIMCLSLESTTYEADLAKAFADRGLPLNEFMTHDSRVALVMTAKIKNEE